MCVCRKALTHTPHTSTQTHIKTSSIPENNHHWINLSKMWAQH